MSLPVMIPLFLKCISCTVLSLEVGEPSDFGSVIRPTIGAGQLIAMNFTLSLRESLFLLQNTQVIVVDNNISLGKDGIRFLR